MICSNCGKDISGSTNRDWGRCPFCGHTPSITTGLFFTPSPFDSMEDDE